MKKYLITCLPLLIMLLSFSSCSKDEEMTDARITYYVQFEIQGSNFVELPVGTNYTDAGCKATWNGEDYTSKITVTGLDKIDKNVPGLYDVTYSATNPEGFTTSVTRTVAVCDPSITDDITGNYVTVNGTKRVREGTETPYPKFKVNIEKKAPGLFYVDDMLGGYYAQKVGYGETTAMKGYILLHADGTITACSGYVENWGDSYTAFTDGKWDSGTGEITWDVTYAKMHFIVVLSK